MAGGHAYIPSLGTAYLGTVRRTEVRQGPRQSRDRDGYSAMDTAR